MNSVRIYFGLLIIIAAVGAIAWVVSSKSDWLYPDEAIDAALPAVQPLRQIAAVGRIEPHRGVIRLAGPPRPAVVIKELRVDDGDRVKKGDVVAVVQGIDVQRADVDSFRAELQSAERELKRRESLAGAGRLSKTELEAIKLRVEMARAGLDRAIANREMSTVRAPIDGQILEIHARAGESVNEKGIVEIGDTRRMYAVAEVYETDIGRVKIGQHALISSPAFPRVLTGKVERIGLLIGKKDILKTDPVADADARVVEVEIFLDDAESAARLTNLRVDIVIEPGDET